MTRSIWKGPNVEVVHRTNRRIKQKKVINIKTHRVVQHGGQSVPIFFYPPTEVPLGTSAYRASLRERSSDIRASDSNRRHSSSTLDDRLHLCKRNWRQLWNIVNSFGVSPSAVVFPTGKQSRGGFRQPCRAVFPPQRGEKWTPRSGESPQSGAINWAPPSALKVVRTSSQGFSSPRYQTVFGRYSRESSDEGSPHLDCFRPEGAKTTGTWSSFRNFELIERGEQKEFDPKGRKTGYSPINSNLKFENISNIKRLIGIASYKGIRHRASLPVRGQRTHTNSKTVRKFFFEERKIVSFQPLLFEETRHPKFLKELREPVGKQREVGGEVDHLAIEIWELIALNIGLFLEWL